MGIVSSATVDTHLNSTTSGKYTIITSDSASHHPPEKSLIVRASASVPASPLLPAAAAACLDAVFGRWNSSVDVDVKNAGLSEGGAGSDCGCGFSGSDRRADSGAGGTEEEVVEED